VSFPHRLNTAADFDDAAQRCEKEVVLTEELYREMRNLLRYDKRKDGSFGLALERDVPSVSLRKGDRLEPTMSFPDVAVWFRLAEFPITLIFWRLTQQSLVFHRNPIWNASLGFTPDVCLTVDILHTLHLGVFAHWCKQAIWMLMDHSTVFAAPTAQTHDEQVRLKVGNMRNALDRFRKDYNAANPGSKLNEVSDITVKMIGTRQSPKLKVGGAETWTIMVFLLSVLRDHISALEERFQTLVEAGDCLAQIQLMMKAEPANPAPAALQVKTTKHIQVGNQTCCIFK
jgi:hypothetical protein